LEAPLKNELEKTGDMEAARRVGEAVGKKAVEKGLKAVVFDRGGNLYHGRVKAVADGAREAGLEF
jgi:large subunit ribosomal protein L18